MNWQDMEKVEGGLKSIKDLLEELEQPVSDFAHKIAACDNRMGDELMDEYDTFINKVHQIAAAWVGKPDHKRGYEVDFKEEIGCRYLKITFSGAMGFSESLYVTATIFTNPEQEEEVESVSQHRISNHRAAR